MRYFRYAVLAMFATLAVSGSADEYFDLPDGFSLSDPKWFGQDIGDKCRLLQFEDRSFGYVTSVLRAGETPVLEKCHARMDDMPESVENGWADGWFKVTPQSTILIPFEPEGLDRFSVPLACGKKLAYWGIPARGSNREEYFAYVVDVPTKSVLKKQSLGTAWLATDWRYYLPFPNWRGDCSEVVFKDDRHFKPVRFTFPGDQEPYLTRYWVSDANDLPDNETDSEYFAYVADLDSGAIIRKALIGQARIATDYRYHLAVPRWRSDCSEVEFDEARYFQPVHFTFSDDGIPAS